MRPPPFVVASARKQLPADLVLGVRYTQGQ